MGRRSLAAVAIATATSLGVTAAPAILGTNVAEAQTTIASTQITVGPTISLDSYAAGKGISLLPGDKLVAVPSWLQINADGHSATVVSIPAPGTYDVTAIVWARP